MKLTTNAVDEPTSGLDSQTSWSICNLMEKLSRNGQAILCTIHQPSGMSKRWETGETCETIWLIPFCVDSHSIPTF